MKIPITWGTEERFLSEDYPAGYYHVCANCGLLADAECFLDCEPVTKRVDIHFA